MNSEIMKVPSNGQRAAVVSPNKMKKKHLRNNNDKAGGTSSDDHDNRKGGGGTGRCSSGSDDTLPAVWMPKFVIALSNKEKEEDFMAIKGSKLPQRPKKRTKQIQLTLDTVSPGAWLCNLSLDRYDVREKKTSKKRQRGLKAMGNVKDSDSELQ